jgi:predicted GIY-YIG superfamily endonuclease
MNIHTPKVKGKICCVYKMVFPDGSFYIGSTSDLRQRISGYRSAFKNCIGSVNKLIQAKAESFNSVEFIIMEEVTDISRYRFYENKHIIENSKNPLLLNRSRSAFDNSGMIKLR